MQRTLLVLAALVALPTSTMAGLGGVPVGASFQATSAATNVLPTAGRRSFKSVRRSGARKKSPRQKCLDMMLPQDGADCMKKLKAKKKKN